MVREEFPSKGTLEWSFSGGERTGRVAIWGKAFQAEGTSKGVWLNFKQHVIYKTRCQVRLAMGCSWLSPHPCSPPAFFNFSLVLCWSLAISLSLQILQPQLSHRDCSILCVLWMGRVAGLKIRFLLVKIIVAVFCC